MKVWKKHFEEVLNSELSSDTGASEKATSAEKISDHSWSLDEDFTREAGTKRPKD